MNTILLADDDHDLNQLLCEYLASQGFEVQPVFDGQEALEQVEDKSWDAIILDVMMPRMDGMETLRRIRQAGNTVPIIMLTAQGEDVDRIIGLELGADDYIPKPCNPRELVARVRAVLRRTQLTVTESGPNQNIGDLHIDIGSRSASLNGQELDITSAEFDILNVMAQNAGEVLAKEQIAEQALGRPLGYNDRSLDMHISKLRRKLGPLPDGSDRIKTVRSRGYLYAKS